MLKLIEQLQEIIGSDKVSTKEDDCVLYAQDVLTKSDPALAVIKPQTKEQLAQSIRSATNAGVDIIPRGGGMSYTSGYVPQNSGAVLVDMCNLNRILEINKEDMYVTVEAGCSWQSLHEELKEFGLRTPFWGTLSGRFATVGGSLSQNSMFWGSTKYGCSAESVISLELIAGDGTSIQTGSAARNNCSPWFRNFGPDLTGLFLGDCGALGFKVNATLKLIPLETANRGLSFASETAEAMLAFSSEVSRQQLASEVCGFDPYLQAQRLKRESLAKDVQALKGVMKSAGGIGKALKAGAKVALAGRGYMKDVKFSVHTLIQETYDLVAEAKEKTIRELAKKHGLKEIENSIPTIMRANPFGPVNSMIGPEAERWAPVHGIAPHSKGIDVYKALEEVFTKNKESIDTFNIGCGYLFTTVGNSSTLIEPVFFWPDELNEIHRHAVETAHLSRLKEHAANPEARAAVLSIRKELSEVFADMGCVHFQIGKSYPYHESLKDGPAELIETIKKHLDPSLNVNPGSLGLGN